MTTKSKAKNAHAFGVGFARVFGCQVVEDLKNKISGSAYAFFCTVSFAGCLVVYKIMRLI